MAKANDMIEVVAKMEPEALSSVYSRLAIEYIRKGNVEEGLDLFDGMKNYKLSEYFDVLFELAVYNHENEFYRV